MLTSTGYDFFESSQLFKCKYEEITLRRKGLSIHPSKVYLSYLLANDNEIRGGLESTLCGDVGGDSTHQSHKVIVFLCTQGVALDVADELRIDLISSRKGISGLDNLFIRKLSLHFEKAYLLLFLPSFDAFEISLCFCLSHSSMRIVSTSVFLSH